MTSFRIDRFLTLYFFHLLLKLSKHSLKLRIPILMYHSISDSRQNGIHPYYETSTSPQVFAEQMKFIHENDYRVINLQNIKDYFNKKINEKAVVITFDDGFYDFYINAFPVLQKYNFPATVFLPTDFIGETHLKFKNKECLSWPDVRGLSMKRILFGSHTVKHYQLKTLRDCDIEFEIKASKEKIEEKIGKSIELFSYPYAFPETDKKFKEKLKNLLNACMYKYGVTTSIGTTKIKDNFLFLKRIPVNNFDDPLFFEAKLNGGYDWVRKPQNFKKAFQIKKL